MATNRIVSKKELEDSGLSLRDFLNKERGLTRKAPEGTKFGVNVARPTADDRISMNLDDEGNRLESETKQMDKMGKANSANKSRADSSNPDYGNEGRTYKGNAGRGGQGGPSAANMASAGAGRGGQGGASSDDLSRANAGTDGYDEAGNAMKRGGKVKGYAKGGSVSSASSRADGIATKGKTRGTMVMCGGGMARGRK